MHELQTFDLVGPQSRLTCATSAVNYCHLFMSFRSKLHGQLEVHRHPEGRWQPADWLLWSAHSHEHHSGLLSPCLSECPERDVRRKVGGVVRLPPLTPGPKTPTPVRTDNLTMPRIDWLGLKVSLTNFQEAHWPNVALLQRAWLTAYCLITPTLCSSTCCVCVWFFFFFSPIWVIASLLCMNCLLLHFQSWGKNSYLGLKRSK